MHQLSCVGNQWELALLQPIGSDRSLGFLMAGQSLSCFFRLKVCNKYESCSTFLRVPFHNVVAELIHEILVTSFELTLCVYLVDKTLYYLSYMKHLLR